MMIQLGLYSFELIFFLAFLWFECAMWCEFNLNTDWTEQLWILYFFVLFWMSTVMMAHNASKQVWCWLRNSWVFLSLLFSMASKNCPFDIPIAYRLIFLHIEHSIWKKEIAVARKKSVPCVDYRWFKDSICYTLGDTPHMNARYGLVCSGHVRRICN